MATRPLEDLLKDVPCEKLDQPCRGDHLSEIALVVTKWKSIAPFLCLTEAEEENIEKDCGENETQKIGMLRKWKKKFGKRVTYRKLGQVFCKLGRGDLVEKVRELLQTDTSSDEYDPADRIVDREDTGVITLDSYVGYGYLLVADREDMDDKDEDDPPAANRRKTERSGSNSDPSAAKKILPKNKKEQVYPEVADREGTGANATERVTLDSYAEYLRGRYSTEVPKFFTLQWPPPPTHKVFNLAMIGHQTIQRCPIDEELVQMTLRGNVDDIMRRKSSIELINLFKLDNRRRKIILIEGAPGAGKSTLAWHVCQKWESGELFQKFKVVVFVQLRDPAVQSAKYLVDILPVESKIMRKEVLSELRSCRGGSVLFVLDGWDEYGAGLQAGSLFQQLICSPEKVNLHFSSLIITSRPIASGELQRYASSRVEIVGFTSAEVKKYFSESIGDSKMEHKLQDHLRERPVIEASCYLPLNAAIVVHLFLALNHTLPHTLHEVFVSLVLCCIIRHLTRQAEEGKEAPDISSLDDLPPELQEPFNNICAMAYHGVMENKATFSASDLRSFNLPTKLSTLSLIQGVQSFTAFKASISCNFLHLSVQELLGAFHISRLPAAEQIKIFNNLFDQPRLAAVFRFYAAFTKLQTEGIRDIVARIVQKKEKPLLVNLLHGLYEAQDPSLCQFVASHLNRQLDLCENTLSPMDCLVVGYFLFCVCLTTSEEFKVDLDLHSLDEYRVSFLVKELSKCSSSVKPLLTMDLRKDKFSNVDVAHIAEILRHSNCLKTLNISYCDIDYQGVKSLASALKMNGSLEEMNLIGNRAVTDIGLMALGESLKRNRGLKTLNISCCGIDDQGMKSLASALEMNGSLEELNLSGNRAVTDIGLMALGESLKRNRALKRLDVSHCGIDDQGVLEMNGPLEEMNLSGNRAVTDIGLMALGESLKRNRALKRLDVSHCGIGDQGVKSLASVLEMNGSLEEMNLSGNRAVTDIGLMTLGESLKRNRALKRLDVSHCGIGDRGMMSLASALEMNSSLEWLNMSGNRAVTGFGLMVLGESLKSNGALKTVNISYCDIDDYGVKSLASALEMNGSLEELNLSGNRAVTGVGFMAMGESFKRNRGLKSLTISHSGIDDQGVKSLASALEMNGSLEELNLSGNRAVTGIGLMALRESLKRNRTLKTLDISYCSRDDQGMKSPASALEMNGSFKC